jgi:hypothetical protein
VSGVRHLLFPEQAIYEQPEKTLVKLICSENANNKPENLTQKHLNPFFNVVSRPLGSY